jgi:hypothetical protein
MERRNKMKEDMMLEMMEDAQLEMEAAEANADAFNNRTDDNDELALEDYDFNFNSLDYQGE